MDDLPIDLLKAIAHPLRWTILSCLSREELNVSGIEAKTGIGQPTLSQQLSVLRQAGLVDARREAKLVYYAIAIPAMKQARDAVDGLLPDSERHNDNGAAKRKTPDQTGAAVFAKLG